MLDSDRTADSYDKDLNPVLESANNEDLSFLVELIKKQLNNSLEGDKVYKQRHPNHSSYADLIAEEIREYGGHSLFSRCPAYKTIVCDVAKRLKAPYNEAQPLEMIENSIITVIIEKAFDKLTDEEKREIIRTVGDDVTINAIKDLKGPMLTALLIKLFNMGGFKSYQLLLIIVNAVWKTIFGHGLKFLTNAALVRVAAIVTGPIGWTLTGVWLVVDLLGPAYRVTIPSVIYIAMLRRKQELEKQFAQETTV